MYGEVEYAIPNSSPSGNRGYTDIVNKFSGNIFEIKPNNIQAIAAGSSEVDSYVLNANIYCSSSVLSGVWNKGTSYPTTIIPTNISNSYLKAEFAAPGVIGYSTINTTNPIPSPILVPSTIADKFKYLVNRLKQNLPNADRIIAEFLNENTNLLNYIKTAAIGAGVVIVVATLLEDIITGGIGVSDDWASFVLAYRIIRYGLAL